MATTEITQKFLIEKGFILREYPDGLFYVLELGQKYSDNYRALQCDRYITNFSSYVNGWVHHYDASGFLQAIEYWHYNYIEF